MGTGKTLIALFVVGLFSTVSMAQISLIADTNNPDPNEEITVYVHTDTPLFCMGLGIYVIGDANITSAMCEADCNNYGWDNGWNSDPYIDPNGYVYIGGVRWASDANGTVGYFKFRYSSGQISIYIDPEWSDAFSYDGSSCFSVPFSTETLLFGQPESNDSNELDNLFSQNEMMFFDFLSSYGTTLTDFHKYNTPRSYSDATILVTDSAYIVYDSNFTLINCIMDVNGSIEFNGDITLTNSHIRVKGSIKCKPGIQITETGASNIRATGDSEQAGKISIEGKIDNPITVL